MNPKEFEKAIAAQTRPIVVETWAEWCGPCKVSRPILQTLAGEFKGQVDFLEVDADQSQDLLRNLRVMAIPTLLVFQNGRETLRQTGAKSPAAYRTLFSQLAEGATPTTFPLTTLDRILRLAAGTFFVIYGLNPTNGLLLALGGIILFSAVYDRCPIWRALTQFIKRART